MATLVPFRQLGEIQINALSQNSIEAEASVGSELRSGSMETSFSDSICSAGEQEEQEREQVKRVERREQSHREWREAHIGEVRG